MLSYLLADCTACALLGPLLLTLIVIARTATHTPDARPNPTRKVDC